MTYFPDRAGDALSPEDFVSTAGSGSDDTDALNAWLAALTATGRPGKLNGKTYLFSSPLVWVPPSATGGVIAGPASGRCYLNYTGADTTVDLITIGDGAAEQRKVHLFGFTVSSSTVMTAGAGLHLRRLCASSLVDVMADGEYGNGHLWNGVWFDGIGQIFYDKFEARAQNDGVRVNGLYYDASDGHGLAVHNGADLYLPNGKITGAAVGLRVGGAFGGLYGGTGLQIVANGIDVSIDNTLTA